MFDLTEQVLSRNFRATNVDAGAQSSLRERNTVPRVLLNERFVSATGDNVIFINTFESEPSEFLTGYPSPLLDPPSRICKALQYGGLEEIASFICTIEMAMVRVKSVGSLTSLCAARQIPNAFVRSKANKVQICEPIG